MTNAAKKFSQAAIGLKKVLEKNRISRKHEKKISGFFQKQKALVLKKLPKFEHYFTEEVKLQQVKNPKRIIDEFQRTFMDIADDTEAELQKVILEAERDGLAAGAAQIKNTISISGVELGSFDLANPRAVAWFKQNGGSLKYIKDIQSTTRDQLKTLITNALDTGQSYTKTAKQVTDKFDEFSRSRAQMIATNETGNAYETGNRIIVDTIAQEIKMQKHWMDSGDELVTPECLANSADGWIPLNEEHSSGHQQPLRFPRCRCYEAYREAKR